MDAIERVDESGIMRDASRAVKTNDLDSLGALLARLEEQKGAYLKQQQIEAATHREIQLAQDAQRSQLAFLEPSAAYEAHVKRAFALTLHEQRARACTEQIATIDRLMKDLRREAELLAARALESRLAARASVVQQELQDAKAALAPLREAIEEALALVREADRFNQQATSARILLPTFHGDPDVVSKVAEIRLALPAEWEELAKAGTRKKEAA